MKIHDVTLLISYMVLNLYTVSVRYTIMGKTADSCPEDALHKEGQTLKAIAKEVGCIPCVKPFNVERGLTWAL